MSRRHHGPDRAARPPIAAGSTAGDTARGNICSTCDHTDTCGHSGTQAHPIYFCEQFEVFGSAVASAATTDAPGEPANEPVANKYKGLCVNCEHWETCALPKPEGGVWHCQEYR